MNTQLAQQFEKPLGEIRGIGPLGLEGKNYWEAPQIFERAISNILGVLTVAAVIWFVLQVIFGAYSWITSGGDPKAVEGARMKVTNAVVGLVMVFVALLLVSVISFLLGIDSILNVGEFIKNLTPK